MFAARFSDVHIEAVGLHMPEQQISSAEIEDKLSPIYEKLKVPFGTLEKLSGVASRGMFTREETPSDVATVAAKSALADVGFDTSEIQTVINCSVTRDYFEPATGVLVHENLGLTENVMAMDITNACAGFSNGMFTVANLIQSGVIKAGLIVAGENLVHIIDATFKELLEGESKDSITRAQFLNMMPTFTLGSGAVAMVLCHSSLATKAHKLRGSVARSASQFKELCVGNGDFCFNQKLGLFPLMETNSQKLISSAAKLGGRTWKDASPYLEWNQDDIDHIVCHQVGKLVNSNFYKTMKLPMEKEYTVYERYGNLVSAAMPSAFITAIQEGVISDGEKVLLTGFGSGLNSFFSAIEW